MMSTWIPWEEIEAKWMKEPGYAEGLEMARLEIEAQIAAERAQRTNVPFMRKITSTRHTAARQGNMVAA